LELTLERPGRKGNRQVELVPQAFTPETVLGSRRETDESWDYYIDKNQKIGYVRVGALDHGTGVELERVVDGLNKDGLRGLILDLRWSPGGYLNEAVLVARAFLKRGTIAKIKTRNPKSDQEYQAQDAEGLTDFPLVVLVNAETMGGAELVAAALQDNKRARVAGQRTFGKASIQTSYPLAINNSGLKLTTGTFLRPSGKALHRFPDSRPADDWGVRPEPGLDVRLSPELSRQLRDWWLWQSLRPGTSDEALPLDDPANDPQRQAALEAVLEMLKKS
jgi:carboxyl-terminal processing protease